MRRRFVDHALDRGGVGHVHRPALHMVDPGGLDLGHHRVDGFLLQVGDGDVRAFAGEQVRGGAAHAAGSAGDKGSLAFDRARQRFIRGLAHGCFLFFLIVPEKFRTGRPSSPVTMPRTKLSEPPLRSTSPRASSRSPSSAPSMNSAVKATVTP